MKQLKKTIHFLHFYMLMYAASTVYIACSLTPFAFEAMLSKVKAKIASRLLFDKNNSFACQKKTLPE